VWQPKSCIFTAAGKHQELWVEFDVSYWFVVTAGKPRYFHVSHRNVPEMYIAID
jgi:hypothetical protein